MSARPTPGARPPASAPRGPDPRHVDFLRDLARMIAVRLVEESVERQHGTPGSTVDPRPRHDGAAGKPLIQPDEEGSA